MCKRVAQAAASHCVLPPRNDSIMNNRRERGRSYGTNIMVAVVVMVTAFSSAVGQVEEDATRALMKFKSALADSDPALQNWNPSTRPCTGNTGNWAGVLCFNGYVWGLQLDNMGLQGQIDVDALAGLSYLRTLSFMNNRFQGSMPDWRKLATLKSLYLSGNQFSGQIPNDAFDGMPLLKKVYLSHNNFVGLIPTSLTSSKPVELGLDNNQFSGAIPAVDTENLKLFNVSNNQLQGPIPPSLLKMDPSSFSGNQALCGGPTGPSCNPPIPPPDLEPLIHAPPNSPPALPKDSSSSSAIRIAILVLSILLALFLLLLLIMLCRRSLKALDDEAPPQKPAMRSEMASPYSDRNTPLPIAGAIALAMAASPRAPAGRGEYHQQQPQQPSKLSFMRDDRQKFDLQDLMRASAEVLGCGSFGASYKAVLVDGEALVVKRFKQMTNVAKEDFHDHMKRLGRLKHPNLLPLVAYLYRSAEKLLVFDFMPNNSLGKHLHDDGKRPEDWPKPLNWACRLRIIKGVTRGLAYLYAELPSVNVPHGHLKSSNVLLDINFNAMLMDYALVPVVNPTQTDQALVAYKCPEYAQTGQTSKKSDIWCLGILILETLTGKPVDKYLCQGSKHYGADLAGWVNGIVEELKNKGMRVFHKDMEITTERSRLEMEKLLHIGIACCREDLDKRLDMDEALLKIEQLQE